MIYDKMNYCFKTTETKVQYALDNTDLDTLFNTLDGIKEPVIVTGLGGSSVVATFLAKVLREKNNIIASFMTPRDIPYMNLSGYKNIICVSYSGNNLGVKLSFDNDLNKYLFTGNPKENVHNIVYKMLKETSYVSINATIVPLSLLFMYYTKDRDLLFDILKSDIDSDSSNRQYEVIYGYESNTAATLLKSCITEAGFGSCVLHDKYNYCHGRINITKNCSSDLIFFDSNNELDEVLKNNLKNYYKKMIIFDFKSDDVVINDFILSILSLKLIHRIAINKNIEISDMKELPDNDNLYLYDGKVI